MSFVSTSGSARGWQVPVSFKRLSHAATSLETGLLTIVFATLVLLPLVEIVMRRAIGVGIEGAAMLQQNVTLVLGMLGAAVAAREDRLLAFSGADLLSGRAARMARIVSRSAAASVSVLLGIAAADLVAVERAGGVVLGYGLPVWLVQVVLPVGFALIALRLLANAGERASEILLAGAATVVTLVALDQWGLQASDVAAPTIVALVFAAALGMPLFAVFGGVALVLLWTDGIPFASLSVDHYGLATNPTLPAIPLFTLAGYLLAESGAPARLIALFQALFGRLRGGAAIVTVLALTFFTALTGASGVAILALGGLAMPLLRASGASERSALGLVTGGGLPGVLLFPSLPLILYAIVARTPIEEMFLAGLLPAALMLAIIIGWSVRTRSAVDRPPPDRKRALAALWHAKYELALPVIPIVLLLGGLATPVESAAATALYAFVIVTFVHRDLRPIADAPRIATECGLLVGGILLVLGVALGFTNYLVDAQIPERALAWTTQWIESPWVFLLALNVVLLLAGGVMDVFTAIVVITPLIVPLGLAFGIDPVHLGMIFLANLELGYLTPPIGMNLFFSSYRFGKPLPEVCRSALPLFAALAVGVLAISYLPWLSTALPSLVR